MGSGFDDWIYFNFFTITINYYNSLLLNVCLANLAWRISHCCLNLGLVSTLLISLLLYDWLTPANELRVLLWPGADSKQNTQLNSLFVVIGVSVTTGIRVHQTVVQQRSIPRCHGNVLSEALPSRWSYFGSQASCYINNHESYKNAYKILVRKLLGKRPLGENLGVSRRIVLKLNLN
jgi:hypothetical protein